jgi:hypothetical protein
LRKLRRKRADVGQECLEIMESMGEHPNSCRINPTALEAALQLIDSIPHEVVPFSVYAVSIRAAGHEDPISSPRERVLKPFGTHKPRTRHGDNVDRGHRSQLMLLV